MVGICLSGRKDTPHAQLLQPLGYDTLSQQKGQQ